MTREIQAREGGNNSTAPPTQISREVGGSFTLFGGRIVGRHLELVPNQRIVQAWRVAYWEPGNLDCSLRSWPSTLPTRKSCSTTPHFPRAMPPISWNGWKLHYWQPLEKSATVPSRTNFLSSSVPLVDASHAECYNLASFFSGRPLHQQFPPPLRPSGGTPSRHPPASLEERTCVLSFA